jgi:hypothetical protein
MSRPSPDPTIAQVVQELNQVVTLLQKAETQLRSIPNPEPPSSGGPGAALGYVHSANKSVEQALSALLSRPKPELL